jgi:hypothetical protein
LNVFFIDDCKKNAQTITSRNIAAYIKKALMAKPLARDSRHETFS